MYLFISCKIWMEFTGFDNPYWKSEDRNDEITGKMKGK